MNVGGRHFSWEAKPGEIFDWETKEIMEEMCEQLPGSLAPRITEACFGRAQGSGVTCWELWVRPDGEGAEL